MKLGYFTDTHARADSPVGRTDDFRTSLYRKLEECGQIWSDERVEIVLFGGDLFHTPDPSNSVKYDIMHILKSWQKPIIGVVGSHDYYGRQMKSLKRTALGLVYKADIMQLVGGEGLPASIELSPGIGVSGTPHTYWLTDSSKNFSSLVEYDFHIQLVHGDLLDKPVPWPHVLVSDVVTSAHLVLSGHYHPGWEEPILGKTVFVNPGSIARLENTGRQRIPRVYIVEYDEKRNSWEGVFRKLKSCEIHPFKERALEGSENTMQDITSLLQLIDRTNVEAVDIKKQLPLVASQMGFSTNVVDRAFQLIEEAAENA